MTPATASGRGGSAAPASPWLGGGGSHARDGDGGTGGGGGGWRGRSGAGSGRSGMGSGWASGSETPLPSVAVAGSGLRSGANGGATPGRVQFDIAPSPMLTPSWNSNSWNRWGRGFTRGCGGRRRGGVGSVWCAPLETGVSCGKTTRHTCMISGVNASLAPGGSDGMAGSGGSSVGVVWHGALQVCSHE